MVSSCTPAMPTLGSESSASRPSALILRWDQPELRTPPALDHLRLTGAPLSRIAPAMILRRTIPCTDPNLESRRDNGCAAEAAIVLSIDDYILSGRIWTAFRTLSPCLSPRPVVVKLHVPEPGNYGALEEAAIEGWVYEARLAGLDAVPAWRGMYGQGKGRGRGKTGVRIVAAVLEDAGEPMGDDEVKGLTPDER